MIFMPKINYSLPLLKAYSVKHKFSELKEDGFTITLAIGGVQLCS